MAENKGKPSGTVARSKKRPGKQGDIKQIGKTAGARKKKPSKTVGTRAVTGVLTGKRG